MKTDLLSVTEARRLLLAKFSPLPAEMVDLSRAVGRVLARPVHADLEMPSFANSSMDGFAVRIEDVHKASRDEPAELEVVADLPAGQVSQISLAAGQTARIMTGAPLPDGANAVVPVEETSFNERTPGLPAPRFVQIYQPAAAGENIRPKGQDVRVGEVVLTPGRKLRPQDIGFLAMLGINPIPLHRRPKVAILSTGDELTPLGAPLEPGRIYDSNAYTLIALVEQSGGEALNLGIARDDPQDVHERLERAVSAKVDLILSSAGVSVGAFDYVRTVVERGGELLFWRINMRPGKPLAFGHYREIPFIGLPGNPVSSFVGFEVFARSAILKMSGLPVEARPTQRVTLLEQVESDGRESYLRGIVSRQDRRWIAHLTGHQGSGNMRSLVQANALLLIPSGVKSLPIGSQVDAWLLDEI